MDPAKTIEDFFWAHLFRFSTADPNSRIAARIKSRLEVECKQYVAFELAKMLKQPTDSIYSGTGEQLLAEAEKKFKTLWLEERDRTETASSERSWWQFWK